MSLTPIRGRRRAAGTGQPPTRLTGRDLLAEAVAGVVQRPARSVLTMLGTVLGVGAFVAVLGLTSTATGQIGHTFDQLRDTTVTVQDAAPTGRQAGAQDTGADAQDTGAQDTGTSFPADTDARLARLNGVVAGGVWWTAPLRDPVISRRATVTPDAGDAGGSISVFAASPGALRAMQPKVSVGVPYNDFHQRRGERVCMLGATAARLLGITRLDSQPAIFVDGTAYTVVGLVADTKRLPQMLLGVIIPSTTALRAYGPPQDAPAEAVIRTRPGAGQLIADQAPLALRPDRPELFKAIAPPDPHSLRDQVGTDLAGLFLVLAAICLAVGALGIANTTLVAVLERTPEIGLRRALGARPRHIGAQFLTESTVLGLLGGLLGTGLGVAVVVVTSLAKSWTAVLEPLTVLPAPLAGALVGFAAGLYPAARAARIEPLDALRR